MRNEVEALISEVIRPLIEADGGAIELVAVDDETVIVRLSQACGGCPGAPYTRSGLIEPLLRKGLGRDVRVKLQRAATRPAIPSALKMPPPKDDESDDGDDADE